MELTKEATKLAQVLCEPQRRDIRPVQKSHKSPKSRKSQKSGKSQDYPGIGTIPGLS